MAEKHHVPLLKTGLENASPGDVLKVGADGKLTYSMPLSDSPSGGKKVVNIYVNSDGKLVVEYDNTPTP